MRAGDWVPVPNPPSRHDHVGHMIFRDTFCYCAECHQTWVRRLD